MTLTPLPPPNPIRYDNSAHGAMSCMRRAQYLLALGIQSKASAEMTFGSAVHRVLECIAKGYTQPEGTPLPIPLLPDDPLENINPLLEDARSRYNLTGLQLPKFKLLVEELAVNGDTHIAKAISLVHGRPAIEYKFEVQCKDFVFCGTIDCLGVEDLGGIPHLLLTDYKATTSKYPSDYLRDYKLKSQLPFYMYMLQNYGHQFLPSKYVGLPLAARIRGIFYECSPFDFRDSEIMFYTPTIAKQIHDIIKQGITYLGTIHAMTRDDELAPKWGMATGACYRCPYDYICRMNDEVRERSEIASIQRSAYDPLKFR